MFGIGVDEEQSYIAVRPVVVVKRRIGAVKLTQARRLIAERYLHDIKTLLTQSTRSSTIRPTMAGMPQKRP